MKRLIQLTITILCGLAYAACAAEKTPFAAGQWSVSPFAAYKITELGKTTGTIGGGIGLSYAPADNIAIEASATSYRLQDDTVIESVDEAAINGKGYLPIGKSGFAPFGLIGYTRDHAQDRNLMNAGVGLAYRVSRFNGEVSAAVRTDYKRRSAEGLLCASFGLTF